jgi:hypothetical protein
MGMEKSNILVLLNAAGLLVSFILVLQHYSIVGSSGSFCEMGNVISCSKVIHLRPEIPPMISPRGCLADFSSFFYFLLLLLLLSFPVFH